MSRLEQILNLATRGYAAGRHRILHTSTDESGSVRICCLDKLEARAMDRDVLYDTLCRLRAVDCSKILQIVGDSATIFSEHACDILENAIDGILHREKADVLIYGLTGKGRLNEGDVNYVVSKWLDADPADRAPFTWGVVTDTGTSFAVKHAEYSFTENCKNFIVITGDATFGDEINVTDSITDVLLVAEGGVQTFSQIVNVMSRPGTVIYAYDSLRSPDNCRFSAAQFLRYLQQHTHEDSASRLNLLDDFCSKLDPLPTHQKDQLEHTWSIFLSHNLFNRLPDIIFNYQ